MSSHTIPYMAVPGTIVRILEKIKTAGTPENFNGDFLANTLGFKGGNYKTFIPWAKKVGFINSDGTPSQLYKRFRNPTSSETSLGEAILKGYTDLSARDENFYNLDKPKLKGLVMEATGEPHDSKVLELMVNTLWNSKTLAKFDGSLTDTSSEPFSDEDTSESGATIVADSKPLSLGLSYTINLVLPKTDDPAVYKAIFKSLKENLLNK